MNGCNFGRLSRLLLLSIGVVVHVRGETLTPPYFNLAEGKKITASATCGVDTEGPELYCKLIGANSENDLNINVIQGQYCDICDTTRKDKRHPPEYAVDGIDTWWQSPPLSRGMKYQEINLTIDLGQEFHVAYVYVKMANSPRPGLWILEKSADYGKTFTPWQYFSDSPSDCEEYFGKESLLPITRDDSVICSTEYSKIVPLEGGEIPISLLNKRPSASHYFNSSVLQEWTRATNVRLRFLRTKNLLGHLMSVAKQDPTVTRRYFYSIKDISIGGRCMCNGHAQTCDIPDPRDDKVLLCRCQHNTCGAKCNYCCPGFEQKAWRQSKHNDPFRCEPCNCFSHSSECVYDKEVDKNHLSLDIHGRYEGGGVCQNCQHNTEGINCNKCQPKFYRPYNKNWNETDVCQPCNCDHFTSTGNCKEETGQCECKAQYTPPNCDKCSFGYYNYPECKPCDCFLNGTENAQCSVYDGRCPCLHNFGGQYCKECAPGFYNFPECKRCECDINGAETDACEQTSGNCTCKNNFAGRQCDVCKDGYYNYPQCVYCSCDISGTEEGICDKDSGSCLCKKGFSGTRCDKCSPGFYDYPNCKPCNCSKTGSLGPTCSATGKCACLENFAGRTCEQCSPGFYSFPECKPCDCDSHGSNGVSCDNEGKCECLPNFSGQQCNVCKEGYYNYPACEDCNCHPAGVVTGFEGCGSVAPGELCKCKERVEGRICNKCKPLFWNLNPNNPDGCENCNCSIAGVLGGIQICDTDNGQCACKPSVIGRSCSECADGSYYLQPDNLFGCQDCGCDVGGSVNNKCDKITGKCSCQSRVAGRTCKEPLKTHYFPTLYQYQYEVENGYTPENHRVRYAHDETVFPNYSWKGYAVFSVIQKEVLQTIDIYKPSLYRLVFKYVNKNSNTIHGRIKITPDNPTDIEQGLTVQFKSTMEPTFVTVSGETGNTPSPVVLNPGRWTVNINVNESIFLDYFVLLPEDFYLATVLTQKVEKPCTLDTNDICRHYAYPNITMYDRTNGVGGLVINGDKQEFIKDYFEDREHLRKIEVGNRVPLLNNNQASMRFNLTVRKPGPYVMLVNYVTPLNDQRYHNIEVQTNGTNGATIYSKLELSNCPYTMMCRQVITNAQDGVGVFQINKNYLPVDLHSANGNVGIHSIYLIPLEEWSLDHIRPKPVCIRKDGKCLPSSFRNPPETKKIQFEQEIEGALDDVTRPPIKEDNQTVYIWLNPLENSIDLKGKVPTPGYYTFVVHYYQPDYPEFDVDIIIQNGQFYEAKVPVKHCPSKSGCRSGVIQMDRNNKFSLTENFMITLKGPENKNVYLDYLLVIPADLYDDRNLEEEDLDRTGDFIATCGNNNFNIDTSHEGFCRDSVFSITAAHNLGALPCQCDFQGSLSFECEKFGGQCQCKDNIIGRNCKACKTGYYGFPDCKPCNCPSTAYCEPETGQCICPPRVVGERCDQCEPLTYGYDPIIGCEECNCTTLGVESTTQCDLLTGSCGCKTNIVGRTCNVCKAGHYAFPYCEQCACDPSGTTPEICAQDTAECFCKKNVIGPQCNFCREGTYHLENINEDGCRDCFCFGKTTRCRSSQNLIKISLRELQDWEIVSINTTDQLNVTNLNLTIESTDDYVGAEFNSVDASVITAYFAAPFDYLGKKLTAYGGYLNYTIFYVIGESGSAVSGPDVIIQGVNSYLTHTSYEQPPPSEEFNGFVQMVESNFELPNGLPAKREHIMEVLKDLRGIYIRATYWTVSITCRLINPIQDIAVEHDRNIRENLSPALTVEHCDCPPNYQGSSCEECAPGYYRIKSGPHGGYCVPCECHGHATECDVNTGICMNCTHNTRGDHCELCNVGYHGNALAGTPMDCLICACPLPTATNNFATACDLSNDGERISCECEEGYSGGRCQYCSAGFYGKPEEPGDYCKPCQCSGNIIANEPGSCDTITGDCLRCLNNTFGVACSLCAPGYFGDAVNLKDCQACICDRLGTDHCDSLTGRCVCKPNVVGEKCDRCELEHYGFDSGNGCTPCNCDVASDSDQCEDATGQCKCKEGVTGRSCDRCAGGYWNYTSEGCVSCGCKSEYSLGFGCNARTGQCECLQGVVGEKCDQCPHRWAFVPEYGCHGCDSCHHDLLDTTDELGTIIDPVIIEFDAATSGYFTRRRLDNMQDILDRLRPKFKEVDPKQIKLEERLRELESLEQDSKNLNRKSTYSLENSDKQKNHSEEIRENVSDLYNDVLLAEEELQDVIDNIQNIYFQLKEDDGAEIDTVVLEAQAILKDIQTHNLTGNEDDADKELKKVNELLQNVTNFKLPSDELEQEVEDIKDDLKNFKGKLDDLYNNTQYSLNKAREAEKIIEKTGKDHLKSKLESIERQVDQSKDNLLQADYLLGNASELLDVASDKLDELVDLPTTLEVNNNNFNTTLANNNQAIDQVYGNLPEVQDHADNLTLEVQELDELFSENKETEHAVRAANAYQDIIKAVNNSRVAAEDSQSDTATASGILTGIFEKTYEAEANSTDVLQKAYDLKQEADEKLIPDLQQAKQNLKPIKESHEKNENLLKEIETILENLKYKKLDDACKNASNNADQARNIVTDVDHVVQNQFAELPMEKEKAVTLPKDREEIRRNLFHTRKQINYANENLPEIIDRVNELPGRHEEQQKITEGIQSKINKLNQQIELARDIANRVKVGVKFFPNTTLELKNPDNLEDLSTSIKVSGYFRTPKEDGLIYYLGNPNGTNLPKTKSDDYMALVIANGYPILKFDVGNGPDQVINEKYVSDNVWYQFIIERIGHHAKLTIREEVDGKEVLTTNEKPITGHYSIFNLDNEKSKLFVGSFPPTNYEVQKELADFGSFVGEMEDLVIGDRPVSLWNFNQGYENNHGAVERNKLVILRPSTGLRFNGNGYAILNARSYSIRQKSDIQFMFKTFATEGLLFLASKHNTFISLELRNGKAMYQYNLGNDTKMFVSPKTYNDGQWHKIRATRDGSKGALFVDNEMIKDVTLQISGNTLEPIETVSFGGYPNKHDHYGVTEIKFDGCINNVTIRGQTVDLRDNIKTFDVLPGCPDKFAPMVSFSRSRPGYIGWDKMSVANDFKVGLKFKTKEKDGLIFYVTDNQQTAGISLALVDGRLKVISQKTELISKDTFNDTKWHVVAVMHNERELRVDFDDFGYRVTDAPPPLLHILHGHMYVGGVPRRFNPLPGTVGSTVPFDGCIADLTVNGKVKNFANTTDKSNEYLASCLLDKSVANDSDVHQVPVLPPLPDLRPVTTQEPEYQTESPFSRGNNTRGDGGFDFAPAPEQPVTEIVYKPEFTVPPQAPGPIGRVPPTTPKPPPKEGCALPMKPADEGKNIGFRFGTQKASRMEFKNSRGKFKKQCDFDLQVRTAESNGLVMFVSDFKGHDNYLALFFEDGYLVFTYKTINEVVVIKTTTRYNDDKFHFIEFSRDGGNGKLVIDNTEKLMGNGRDRGFDLMDLKPPFYIGGLPPHYYNDLHGKLNVTDPLMGCIKFFNMNGKPMTNPTTYGIIPCSDNVETGTFFGGEGWVRLREKFKVGYEFNIKMDIKPRDINGVLIAVHGKRDFFVIELFNGELRVIVDNGKKPFMTVFRSKSKYDLCDGNWHSIQAVKSNNVITLSVDNVFSNPQIGDRQALSTDTGSNLFLGGHRYIKRVRGIQSKKPYTGCIRNVFINNEPVDIVATMVEGDINVGSCRTN